MYRVLLTLLVLAHSVSAVEARNAARDQARIDAAAKGYLAREFFGVNQGRPTENGSSQYPTGSMGVVRMHIVGGTAAGDPGGCGTDGIDVRAYYEPVQGTYCRALLIETATALKARGVTRVLMSYLWPDAWTNRGNRYEVIADISAPATDVTISAPGNVLVSGEQVVLVCGVGSALPGGVACNTNYRVCNRTSTTFQLSSNLSSCASLIDTTGTGSTGSSFVLGRSVPGDAAAFKAYIKDVILTFRAQGVEVWGYEGNNEPYVGRTFFQPDTSDDSAGYTEVTTIQQLIYEAVRETGGKTKVFLAPPPSFGKVTPDTGSCSYGGICSVSSAQNNARILRWADVVGFHAYPAEPDIEEFYTNILAAQSYIARRSDSKGKPLAFTEYNLYSNNGTDGVGGAIDYVMQRVTMMAATGVLMQSPYGWDQRGGTYSSTAAAMSPATGDGSRTVFYFSDPATGPSKLVDTLTTVFRDGVPAVPIVDYTFTSPDRVTFTSAPGVGVALTATHNGHNFGWEMMYYQTSAVNPYGTAYLTMQENLVGTKPMGAPVFSGDTVYTDFQDRSGGRRRVVFTKSGAAGTHTVPIFGAKWIAMDGTETATTPGTSLATSGRPIIIR